MNNHNSSSFPLIAAMILGLALVLYGVSGAERDAYRDNQPLPTVNR